MTYRMSCCRDIKILILSLEFLETVFEPIDDHGYSSLRRNILSLSIQLSLMLAYQTSQYLLSLFPLFWRFREWEQFCSSVTRQNVIRLFSSHMFFRASSICRTFCCCVKCILYHRLVSTL